MTTPTAEESRALLAQLAGHTTGPWVIAAHLRAALDREAALIAERDRAMLACEQIGKRLTKAEAERDAARAEADRLREAASVFDTFFQTAMRGFSAGYAERRAADGDEAWGWNDARLYYADFLKLSAALASEPDA